MKEIKDKKIDVRLTADEKEQIQDYAKRHNVTVSELLRSLVKETIQKENEK